MQRPTLQARAGFDPYGYGPGISAPFGYSPDYQGGDVHHNGQDCFWLSKASADRLGISTEQSKRVYAVVDGPMHHIDDSALGLGVWQQIDANHRAYSWHLRDRQPPGNYTTDDTVGRMGSTGTSGGDDEHLHFETRRAPYRKSDRINPAPFFGRLDSAGDAGKPIKTSKEHNMPYLVPLVVGNPPTPNGDYAIIGDGGIVGLRAKEDAALINIAKRAMLDGEPIYGNQGDQLQALFARVAVKADIDYTRLASEVAKLVKVPTASENGAAARAAIVKP